MDKRTLALTVVTYWWGDWCGNCGPKYVEKLYYALKEHTTVPYDFVCFTDQPEKLNVPCVKFKPRFKWNLNKFEAYNHLQGRILTLDLDTLILKNIDDILEFDEEFITCSGAYQPNKAGGSIVGTTAEYGYKNIWLPLINSTEKITKETGGSERFFFRKYLSNIEFFQNKYQGIYSYKVDGMKSDARIVIFHGKPRPHEKGFL